MSAVKIKKSIVVFIRQIYVDIQWVSKLNYATLISFCADFAISDKKFKGLDF